MRLFTKNQFVNQFFVFQGCCGGDGFVPTERLLRSHGVGFLDEGFRCVFVALSKASLHGIVQSFFEGEAAFLHGTVEKLLNFGVEGGGGSHNGIIASFLEMR